MFKKITVDAILPQAQTKYSAGYDVYADEDVIIGAGETKTIALGIALDSSASSIKNYYFGLYLRSGLGVKGLILPNGVGIIDFDYEGEMKMIIHNPIKQFEINRKIINTHEAFKDKKHIESEDDFLIKKGDRIGQLILHKHHGLRLLGDKYRKNAKRTGGFGSTGDNDVK